MNPADDGDVMLQSVQWQGGAVRDKVEAVGALVRAGYDPTKALEVVGLPAIPYMDVQPVTVRPVNAAGTQIAPADPNAEDPQ
jgi:hypothetical protein